jgi:DNA repair exonuclease SbcCD ATPase subunit
LGARTLKEAQELLEELLGLDWMSFKNTVLYGQGDILHFADPRTTDTQRKSVLSKILRLERLDDARKLARERRTAADREVARLEGEIAVLDGQLDTLGVGDLKAEASRWERDRDTRVEAADAQLTEAEADLKAAKAAARKLKKYERRADDVALILDEYKANHERWQELRDEDADLMAPVARLRAEAEAIRRSADAADQAVAELEAGRCPTCGAPSTSLHVKRRIAKLRTDAGRIRKGLEAVQAEEAGHRRRPHSEGTGSGPG